MNSKMFGWFADIHMNASLLSLWSVDNERLSTNSNLDHTYPVESLLVDLLSPPKRFDSDLNSGSIGLV